MYGEKYPKYLYFDEYSPWNLFNLFEVGHVAVFTNYFELRS